MPFEGFAQPAGRAAGLALLATWILIEALAARQRRAAGDTVVDSGTRVFLVLCLFAGIAAAIVIAANAGAAALPGPPAVTFVIGAGIATCGFSLRAWSILTLGRFFTRDVMIRSGHQVVSRGPYRVLRHPSYAGLWLILTGFGLMLGNWLSLLVIIGAGLVSLLPRIYHEEHVLNAHLGDAYRDYAEGRKRLIPFVW